MAAHEASGVGDVRARAWLFAYLAAVVAATLVHSPALLGGALVLTVAFSGPQRGRLLRRTLVSVLAFNLAVSLGYALVTLWQGGFRADYLLLVNLRVGLMVYLGLWFAARVDVLAALRGWSTLTWLAALALGQIRSFERLARDFRLAFTSRNPCPPALTDRARHAAAQAGTLAEKALAGATESAQALRSRGVFEE